MSIKPNFSSLIAFGLLSLSGCLKEETAVVQNPPPPSPVACTADTVYRTGQATFYDFASGAGNCLFDSTPTDLMVGAMNTADYAGSEICGTCLQVIGPLDTIRIRVVDRCPGCGEGGIDLSPLAFSLLADTSLGRVAIKWRRVECRIVGPIVYHFKDGSNQWWTAVQIRNHRYPVATVEYLTARGAFKSVSRTDYNYFVEPSGMGPGPFTFRVTDIYGDVLVDSGIVHLPNLNVAGKGQFPECVR